MAWRITQIAAIAGFTCLAVAAQVQTPAAKPPQQPVPLSAERLKDGVYWVKGGSGANTGFVIGKQEVVVIDAKMTDESAKAMQAEIGKVTANPVKYIVLTHSDGDHVNGLSGFPKGLAIIAHANTKKDMEEAFKSPKMSALLPYLPTETFPSNRRLNVAGARMDLLYFGPAHTNGDVVVYLPSQKIAFIGDLAFTDRDPLVHRQKGGTSFGLVQVLKKITALDADTFITGHSDPLKKADIQALVTSIEEKQAKVKELVQQGKSLDDVRTAFGVPGAPGQPVPRFPSFVEVIYQELTEKK